MNEQPPVRRSLTVPLPIRGARGRTSCGRPSTAWKDLERRIAVAWGGRRRGVYQAGSDIVGTPVSIEVKRSKRRVPEGRWIAQAAAQGEAEELPWVLVVAGHGDREPIAVCEHSFLLELARTAGLIEAAAAGRVRRSRGRQAEQLPLEVVRPRLNGSARG